MDLKELSEYLISLLRSDPEVIVAFFMGALLTVMMAFWLRLWVFQKRADGIELARKDTEIAKLVFDLALTEIAKKDKDAELSRKDKHIAEVEARLWGLEARLLEQETLVGLLHQRDATLTEQNAAIEAICAGLKTENDQLRQGKQAIEADAATLRTRLAHALAEVRHWAKWFQKIEEENARLMEVGSHQEG